jgi:Uncharacterized protein involved in copper resistance
MKLEVIGFGIDNCLIAQQAGANRIELCDNPSDGGTTPSYGCIVAARKKLQIELFTMIRPRGGDFLYSEEEFEIMKSDVLLCKKLGCDGIVTGLLTADGKVDKERTSQLVTIAYPLGVTFHRAFDRSAEPFEAMQDIIGTGCERILTSGQKNNAYDGAALIKQLIDAADDRIIIMPGAGVRAGNIRAIAEITGASEFHTSAKCNTESKMIYHNKLLDEKQEISSVDAQEIEQMIKNLASIKIL